MLLGPLGGYKLSSLIVLILGEHIPPILLILVLVSCELAKCAAPYHSFSKTRVYIDLQSTSAHDDSDVSPLLATQ
jgi:hypothetical protein